MNTKYFILALSIASLTACSTAYQAGQTPDDVYYSPAKERGDSYVQMDKRGNYNDDRDAYYNENYGGSGNSYYSPEDRFLRMRVQNRALWSGLDPYFFDDFNYYGFGNPYYSSGFGGGFGHGYYGGYNGFGFNSFGLSAGFSPWGSSFLFGRPWGYSMWNNYYNPYMPPIYVYPGDKGNIGNNNSNINRQPINRAQNINNSYRNSTINNRNNTQGTFRNGNSQQRTTINNSNSERRQSSNRDTYTPPRETPTRTYNPVNSGSSNSGSGGSGGSNSGGGGVSRPTRN